MRDFKEASIIIKKKVGERFRALRERAGHGSARSAADALGVSANTVGELERGENWLSPEIAARAIVSFNVPLSAFFGDQEPIAPTPQEALAVLARELAARAPPAPDPLAERFARILKDEGGRIAADLWIQGVERRLSPPGKEPPDSKGKFPEKGK